MTCDIKWAPSESDGGSPITHYKIESRTNNGEWKFEDNLQTPTGSEKLEFKITGLTENDKVQFRTIAVNKGGESPPSDPSPLHTVKHSKSKYESMEIGKSKFKAKKSIFFLNFFSILKQNSNWTF